MTTNYYYYMLLRSLPVHHKTADFSSIQSFIIQSYLMINGHITLFLFRIFYQRNFPSSGPEMDKDKLCELQQRKQSIIHREHVVGVPGSTESGTGHGVINAGITLSVRC